VLCEVYKNKKGREFLKRKKREEKKIRERKKVFRLMFKNKIKWNRCFITFLQLWDHIYPDRENFKKKVGLGFMLNEKLLSVLIITTKKTHNKNILNQLSGESTFPNTTITKNNQFIFSHVSVGFVLLYC